MTTSLPENRLRRWAGNRCTRLTPPALLRQFGTVRTLRGLAIEAEGPACAVGELCAIWPLGSPWPDGRDTAGPPCAGAHAGDGAATLAEVVGVRAGLVTLMPFGAVQGLAPGCTVQALGASGGVRVGDGLLGRVIDAFGAPLDGLAAPRTDRLVPLHAAPQNPMQRPRIASVLETGVRAIDGLLTLGRGQRVGIFAGSGVGKSTLLGMIARHVQADVNVIALIGERGREVREFIDRQLGPEGLARSVVVVASADQPALARIRAAHAAVAIAEHFRALGRHVVLTMDSVTRLAMARREVGLAAGEPPTARGYTPSVFAELPALCERCGTAPSGGSITALFTVLVEGDDFNEPISDTLRAVLDGHIVLSRQLAQRGQYPAVDVLQSASRVLGDIVGPHERALLQHAVRVLALLERNRQAVELGLYERGSNPELDHALAHEAPLREWLRQTEGGMPRAQAMQGLQDWHAAWSPTPTPIPQGATA
ncbi:FliI/YscN family ATPase [Xylophilus rhododendri]|uniref:FliI/YscN family ATPase n=1 Tax=Xylophilus rhododendri TaxID=2697032 RepID=A0A857J597_9BURK|nr:FliI/YscN family ATPase [Xylophilus rhododendri]QHI99164.1 FliI/YscN family ATPase [Xylophilus rhododendri]